MNKFTRLYRLGKGSFGEVVAARDNSSGELVAIKLLKKKDVVEWHTTPKGIRVPLEAYILRKLRGIPGVPQFLDYEEDEWTFSIIMEKPVEAVSLREYLAKGTMREEDAKRVFSQLASTLHKIWEAGFCHRDLKTENILVNPWTLKSYIIDFGLSSKMSDDPVTAWRGTRNYLSPEAYTMNNFFIDEAEVWSLGVLLYRMVHKNMPFDGMQDVIKKRVMFRYGLSRRLRRLLLQMLEKKPLKRISLDQVIVSEWLL